MSAKTKEAVVMAAQRCADEYPAYYIAENDPLAEKWDHALAVDELLKHLRALLVICHAHAKSTKPKGRK